MEMVCVFVPIHNPNPTSFELISFQQCFRVFGKYPIIVVSGEEISLDA